MDLTDHEDFESDGRMRRRWTRRLHEWCPFGRLLRVNRIGEAETRMGVPLDDDRSIQFASKDGRTIQHLGRVPKKREEEDASHDRVGPFERIKQMYGSHVPSFPHAPPPHGPFTDKQTTQLSFLFSCST